MYGPKWPFLHMYGSHDLRHTGFPRGNGLSMNPRDLGRHMNGLERGCWNFLPFLPFCLSILVPTVCKPKANSLALK